MKLKSILLAGLIFSVAIPHQAVAQLFTSSQQFTHQDTLRGSNGADRAWWDATKYDLHVSFNITDSTIKGYNRIQFKALKPSTGIMQIDLQSPMVLDSAAFIINEKMIFVSRKEVLKDGNAYFIRLPKLAAETGRKLQYLQVYYHGKPIRAVNPPWDGGLIWENDALSNPWVSVACQGLGASVWYPCKDIQLDEPDSAEMHLTIPDNLVAVGNGKFRGKQLNHDGTATYDWAVVNPINNYCLIPSIGKYVHFGENYKGEKGDLAMDYWVLANNEAKAKKQFTDAVRMMKAFEYWFGPYPFYEDGYKLVESPHLGMEHQSATAYGNKFQNGYLGRDLSGTGWGLKWDYIIVHESGHEWFANNISTKDIADMWVHEGFTDYSEALFTEYYYGKAAGNAYVQGIRKNIENDRTIIGPYGVNQEGSSDMYYKGANLIHTIRQVINNDSLFKKILRGLNAQFYHQTVTTAQVEGFISQQSKIDFSTFFDQYLRTTQIPVLEWKASQNGVQYRYTNCIKGFRLPLKVNCNGQQWIRPTEIWQTLKANLYDSKAFSVDANFYLKTKKVD